MTKIMQLAHEFLQKFCHKNETNQNLLHRHLDLFLLSGDNVRESLQWSYMVTYTWSQCCFGAKHWS